MESDSGRMKESRKTNPNVTTLRYLTVTTRADNEANARVYLNSDRDNHYGSHIAGWGSRELKSISTLGTFGNRTAETDHVRIIRSNRDYINLPSDKKKHQKDWKNDILPRRHQYSIHNNMVMGDTYVTVLFGTQISSGN